MAKPAPLYVHRPVTNAADLVAWARSQGFKSPMPAEKWHVTQAYSRKPVDWHAAGDSFDKLKASGGARTVSPLGKDGAVVLHFDSADLRRRWREFRDAGASWDYDAYRPHVTITYDGGDVDLSKVEPYTGPIEFGPEVFEALKENPMAKALPLVLLFKSMVPTYTRHDGTVVQAHSTKVQRRASAHPGQGDLFREPSKPLGPNPYKGKGPVKDTGDLFADTDERQAKPRAPATETPEFKKWFGNSKVVDKDGKPLVVYHGTKSDFGAFDLKRAGASDDGLAGRAFYLTYNPEEASGYAEGDNFGRGDSPNVMPVFVSMQNPLRIVDGKLPDGRSVMSVHNGFGSGINSKGGAEVQRIANEGGHDGVMWVRRDGGVGHVAVFRPNQIKSATGNRGTFDPSEADITKALAGARVVLRKSGDQQLDALIAEHERLVGVLNSPDHADDRREAKKQARELAGYRRERQAQ